VKRHVRDRKLTRVSSGATSVEVGQDVGRAAGAAVVLPHAPAEAHSTVASVMHDDQLIVTARRVKRLPLTVLIAL